MIHHNRRLHGQPRLSDAVPLSTLILIAMLAAVGLMLAASSMADSSVAAKCKADLATKLKLEDKEATIASTEPVTWSNAALGMPEIGKMYAQVLTPGSRVLLQARNSVYLYTTSAEAFKYGGPLAAWSYSMLYLEPVQSEANLNGDLYQCSLLGTNPVRLLSAVSDYYPQGRGIVVAKRRTSRSFHDLLYVNARKPGEESIIHHGMDFGEAAVNPDGDRWAGFVKPKMGADWVVVIDRLKQGGCDAKSVPLPDGVRPGQIAWPGESVIILVKKNGKDAAYECDPNAEKPEWNAAGLWSFPGWNEFVLNKSESLVVEPVEIAGKPGVEVARVWFTGDRNVVAQIAGFTMRGCRLAGPYAFIWGEKDSAPAVYSVDINKGDSLLSLPGKGHTIKPFGFAPHDSPAARPADAK